MLISFWFNSTVNSEMKFLLHNENVFLLINYNYFTKPVKSLHDSWTNQTQDMFAIVKSYITMQTFVSIVIYVCISFVMSIVCRVFSSCSDRHNILIVSLPVWKLLSCIINSRKEPLLNALIIYPTLNRDLMSSCSCIHFNVFTFH